MYKLNLSRRDISFMKLFYTISSIFALCPRYDFEKQTISRFMISKIYAFVCFGFLLVVSACVLCENLKQRTDEATVFVLTFFNLICLLMTTLIMIFNSGFMKYDSWLKLNRNLQYVDQKLNNQGKEERVVVRNVYFQFALSLGAFLVIDIYVSYTCFIVIPQIVVSKTFCLSTFCYSCEFIICWLICNLTIAIKYRFEDIDKILCKLKLEHTKSSKFDAVKTIRDAGMLWRTLTKSVVYFNKIFGWPLLLLTTRLLVQILQSFAITQASFDRNLDLKSDNFSRTMATTNLFIFGYILVCMIFIIMCCDSATAASRNTLTLCYKIQECFAEDSKQRRELLLLAREVSDNTTRFTAAGFFDINRKSFLGILSVTTTYFIIIMQYNVTDVK